MWGWFLAHNGMLAGACQATRRDKEEYSYRIRQTFGQGDERSKKRSLAVVFSFGWCFERS